IYNIVAVISYPGLSAGGLEHHEMWGLMLLVLTLRGTGALSVDRLLGRWMGGAAAQDTGR
ncbi:MAG: DoxX family protein, partial [Gammaproteobacteria bacterium]